MFKIFAQHLSSFPLKNNSSEVFKIILKKSKCGNKKYKFPHFLVFQLFLFIKIFSSTVEIEEFSLLKSSSVAKFAAFTEHKMQNVNFLTVKKLSGYINKKKTKIFCKKMKEKKIKLCNQKKKKTVKKMIKFLRGRFNFF